MNSLLQNSLQDVRYTFRQLRKSPGFTLTAVLTLAFGIGATTAIFSIVEGVLLRQLPFPEPSRLMVLSDVLEGANFGGNSDDGVTIPEILAYQRDTHGFSSMGGYSQTSYELSGAGEPAQVNASRMSAGVFTTLGVAPMIGRTFTPQEDEGSQQVAVISYEMWNSRFHGDTQILGRKILLDRKPYEIIGVMPRNFEFPLVPGQLDRSQLWVPLSPTPDELKVGAANWSSAMVGRLKPGVTPAEAQQDAELVAQQIMRNFPAYMTSLRIRAVVRPLREDTVEQARPLIRTLFLAVVVVLFIACANLAGLLLVRVIRRRRELAVRLALGASGGAVLRQTLIETLVLSLTGGLLGLGLASVALRVGISYLPETLPRISSIVLDWKVESFALIAALATGLICGIAPAFAASRTNVNEALKEGGRTGSTGSAHARLRSELVIAEVAVALVLLIASGLLLRSFEKLREVNLGFRTNHILSAQYDLPQRQYSTQSSVDGFGSLLLSRLEQLPSVQAVGVTTLLPGSGQDASSAFLAEGYVPPKGSGLSLGWPSHIMGDYFSAMGIPLLRGREFTPSDRPGSQLVVIVNRTLAEHYWSGQDPIGKRLRWGMQETPTPWLTVVGEVGDVKQSTADAPTMPQIYQPASQGTASFGSLAPPDSLDGTFGSIVVRSALPPDQMANSVRAVVRSIDLQLPLTQVESMDRVIAEGETSRRFSTTLISSFAAVAVLLALLGIYSVIAFSATLRTQEMAIRLALGAQRGNVLCLILRSGAKLGLIGCGIGAIAALFATRMLRTLLFQVDPLDPAVIVLAAIAIFMLALAASLIPALRAAATEPVEALRNE